MQQYRIRYLLARITQHVEMAFIGVKVPGSLEIEHILPNTPTAELLNQWAVDNLHVLYDDYKNRLGNLTRSLVDLVVVGQNSSVARINEKFKEFPEWNATSIDDRQGILIEMAKNILRTVPIEG